MAVRPLRRPRSGPQTQQPGHPLHRTGPTRRRSPPTEEAVTTYRELAVEMLPEAHESFRAVIGALCPALQANREAFLPLSDASWGGYPRPVSKRKAANPMPSC
jgi:hypothetical protein